MSARAWMAMGAVLVAAAGGCGGGSATQWPEGSAAGLVPSGLMLAGGADEGDVAVDGAGVVWVDGPWQVARVDPTTGTATIWDAADDLAFTSVRRLAPAQPAGVWLDSGDRVRLFDGERFLVDVAVPAQYADGPDGQGPEGEVLQVGDELWASGAGGVARWAEGSWSAVGMEQLSAAGPLALDSEGAVWAGGVRSVNGSELNVVVRFDGSQWTTPGNAEGAPIGGIGDLAADPSGGVWVASTQDGPTTDQHGVYRFDGTTWSRAGPGGYAGDMAVTSGGQLWAMVGAGNGIDPSGEVRVARLAADGSWESFGSAEGAPEGGEFRWPALAVVGGTVVVSDVDGLVRSEGDRFVTMWRDPTSVVQPGFEIAHGQVADGLLAVSADEAWLPAAPLEGGPAGLVPGTGLARYRDGAWVALGPVTRGDLANAPVLATDGAVWVATGAGLVRIEGDASSVVADDLGSYTRTSVAAGEDGCVWTIAEGDVVRVCADGARTSIGRPKGTRGLWEAAALTAGPGVVWTTVSDPDRGLAWLARWDGRWSTMGVPEPYTWVPHLLVARDGAVWAVIDSEHEAGQALARYTDGQWTVDRGGARGLAQTPAGEVCSIRDPGVVCYTPVGLAAGAPVSTVPVAVNALGIAPDGSAWVLGEQVARLPGGSTGSRG
ncbi:MAG TPA: hypothetical protein VES03_04080 [Motilibacterales bacterium]|nr:hypothetical protein [Motilibacterales bacterium]